MLVGLCLTMGASLVGVASINYIVTPMIEDLGLTSEQGDLVLAVPWLASLLIVFVAGRLGDRLGHRRIITWMSIAFMAGSAIFAVADGFTAVMVGLLVEGVASTALQIVVFGLLSQSFSEPKARAAAFGVFGMASPFIWMCFPVLAGWIVGEASWRWVAAVWVLAGFIIFLAARLLLPRHGATSPLGEIWTPILAGATVAGATQALTRIRADGLTSPATLATIAVTAALGITCAILLRRLSAPTFTVQPMRVKRTRSLLGVVVIIPLINTVFLMTIAFQYLYGLTALQTAIVMVPAQAAAVLGTRLVAGPLMRKIGVTSTATLFFGLLIVTMLCAFFVTADSPLWVPILYVTAYNALTVAASITVTSGMLASDPATEPGFLSAYRGSGVALGGTLAVVLMNTAVFNAGQLFMTDEFEANGLSESDAASLSAQIQADATSPDLMSQYAVPLPSGLETNAVMMDSIAAGLHVNGVLGAILAIVCILLVRSDRRVRA